MPRLVDLGIAKYMWVVGDTGIPNVSSPSAATINAGKDISAFVVTTTTIQAAASDTTSERSVVETANVVVPTIGNYEGTLNLFRDYASGAPATTDLLATFKDGVVGFLVRRLGKPASSTIATADVVEVYKFRADNVQVMGGTGEGYLKMVVPLLQQGAFDVAAVVAA